MINPQTLKARNHLAYLVSRVDSYSTPEHYKLTRSALHDFLVATEAEYGANSVFLLCVMCSDYLLAFWAYMPEATMPIDVVSQLRRYASGGTVSLSALRSEILRLKELNEKNPDVHDVHLITLIAVGRLVECALDGDGNLLEVFLAFHSAMFESQLGVCDYLLWICDKALVSCICHQLLPQEHTLALARRNMFGEKGEPIS